MEALLDSRTSKRRGKEYLVKWKGYPEDWNEYVKADNLREDIDKKTFTRLVSELEARQEAAPANMRKRKNRT